MPLRSPARVPTRTSKILRPTPSNSFGLPTASSGSASWEKNLSGSQPRSLPDILQILAIFRPKELKMLERLARAFAEPVLQELESNQDAS